jgi:hypothetical protein
VDIRSDLYSLGCTLYFMLAGRAPFYGRSPIGKLIGHFMEEAESLRKLRPGVPSGVVGIVEQLMAKSPDQRLQTPAAVARELAPWCNAQDDWAPDSKEPGRGGADAEAGSANTHQAYETIGPCGSTAVRPPIDKGLRKRWREWTEMVALLVRGGGRKVDPEGYRALHQGLLESCRAQAGRVAEEGHIYFQRLEDLAKPWLTVEILRRTDEEILHSLLRNCYDAEMELERWSSGGWLLPDTDDQRTGIFGWILNSGTRSR